ncbi:MAG TPA: hypothetical protein PKL31_12345 [Fulvivirga sp.]|nr:hypothetical protein [Fulvivirga sp.]
MPEDSDPSVPNSKFENQVILITILTGFIGSVILYFLKLPPVVIAIFLGSGIAALVFRFLGGTAGTTMAMGTLKLSGSIAVLLGSAYYVNQQLEKQLTPIAKGIQTVTFTPQKSTWMAIDKASGSPIDLLVNETNQNIKAPQNSSLKNNPLKLSSVGDKLFVTAEGNEFELGQIAKKDLKRLNLFDTIQNSSNYVVTDRLNINKLAVLTPLPFYIKTIAYANEYSQFQILDKSSNEVLIESQIYRRRFQITRIKNKTYLIGVVEVNHTPLNPDDPNSLEPYAKFVIAEIVTALK